MDTNEKMHGVVTGYFRCNEARDEELNNRISDRNIPSTSLQPQYSIRPVATKYGYMPILDQNKKVDTPLKSYTQYSTSHVFNPGNSKAPWSGFSNNVNIESTLRNQFLHYRSVNNLNLSLRLTAIYIKQLLILNQLNRLIHYCLINRNSHHLIQIH